MRTLLREPRIKGSCKLRWKKEFDQRLAVTQDNQMKTERGGYERMANICSPNLEPYRQFI